MENQEYYDMIKKKIDERHRLANLYYSKLGVKVKLQKEIDDLFDEINALDNKITVLTPHSSK